MRQEAERLNWYSNDDLETSWNHFKYNILNLINKHIPKPNKTREIKGSGQITCEKQVNKGNPKLGLTRRTYSYFDAESVTRLYTSLV